jgi:hypothetical protein
MRIVLSNISFSSFSGTETYTLTVAHQLERLGHEAMIYANDLGPMAEHARGLGLTVRGSVEGLPAECDAVIAQDGATAYELAGRYPSAARIFVMHSRFPLQSPPPLGDVCQAVVVLNDRLLETAQRARLPRVVRLTQPVDLARFRGRRESPRRPLQLLSLSNHARGARERMIDQACAELGYTVVRRGAGSTATANPEHTIAGADIVISLGRGAVESMAAGRAVYVLGPIGGDGWVTPDSYPALERDGFSGRATGLIVGHAQLTADLARFNEEMGELTRDLAWTHHDAERHAAALIDLLGDLGAPPRPPTAANELARLIRLEWHQFCLAQLAQTEHEGLRAQLDRSRLALNDVESELVESERKRQLAEQQLQGTQKQLAALKATRRYRLAAGLARPLDRLRDTRRWRR